MVAIGAVGLLGKLGVLFVKQASKPFSNYVKREAKQHPRVSDLLVWVGRGVHATNINISRVITGQGWLSRGGVSTMAPITRDKAIETGAELLGEGIIFTVAGATVAVELLRQQRAKQATEEKAKDNERRQWEAVRLAQTEREQILKQLTALNKRVEELEERGSRKGSGSWLR